MHQTNHVASEMDWIDVSKTEVSCTGLRAQTYLYSWVYPMTTQDICWGAAAKRVDMFLLFRVPTQWRIRQDD